MKPLYTAKHSNSTGYVAVAPRPISRHELDQAEASLRQLVHGAASRLVASASRLLAWVFFQTQMCGRPAVKAAFSAVARDIGASERTVWNSARLLEDRKLLANTRGNGSAKVWELAAWPKPLQQTSATSVIEPLQPLQPLQKTSAICSGLPRARAVGSSSFSIKPKGNHHQTTALIVESATGEQDDDEAPLKPTSPGKTTEIDGHAFILQFQRELHRSRNLDTRLSGPIDPPTFRRALAILTEFGTDQGAFPRAMAWLNNFDRAGKQERINAAGEAGYGFYRADAEREAKRIREQGSQKRSAHQERAMREFLKSEARRTTA